MDIIEELSKDFLRRDGKTFVHKRRDGRMGWEDELEGRSYSSVMTSARTTEELLKESYDIANNLLLSLAFKSPVRISFKGTSESYTDGTVINVATNYFDLPESVMPTGEKADVFIGLTVHESCHVLHTDFKALRTIEDSIVRKIQNIVEDERIEELLGEEYPGLANFLEKVKKHYWSKVDRDLLKNASPLARKMHAILGLVRYPAMLTEDELRANADLLLKTRDILTPWPASTAEVIESARKIRDLLAKDLKNEEEKKKKEKEDDRKGAEDKDGDSTRNDGEEDSEEKENGNGPGKEDEAKDGDSRKEEQDGKDGGDPQPEDGEDEEEDEDDGDGEPTQEDIDNLNKEFEKIKGAMADAAEDPNVDSDDRENPNRAQSGDRSACCKTLQNETSLKVVRGECERGDGNTVLTRMLGGNETMYRMIRDEIKQYIPATRKAIQTRCNERPVVHRGLRNGHLDANRLCEAVQGVPNVYTRNGHRTTSNLAVVLLIDESGSMSGRKIQAARQTAVLLKEALEGMSGIETFIYGHSTQLHAGSLTDILVYKDRTVNNRFNLSGCASRKANLDYIAIDEVTRRVRRQTKDKALLIVISDGMPCSLGNGNPVDETRKAVKRAESNGFIPVQISIDQSCDPKLMFDHYLRLTDMGSLAREMSAMVKDAIRKYTTIKTN